MDGRSASSQSHPVRTARGRCEMMELFITTTGLVRALYHEAIPVKSLGSVQIARASQVEPDSAGNWWADLAPSRGPVLGPFADRSAALQAEQQWLTRHVLLPNRLTLEESTTHDSIPSRHLAATQDSAASAAVQTSAGGSHLSRESTGIDPLQHASCPVREA